jgi:hypothetical protein
LEEKVAASVYKAENMAVGIHHADYVDNIKMDLREMECRVWT